MDAEQIVELDVRGQVCPSTLLATLREVTRRRSEIRAGALRLVIRTDNRNATVTVPQAAADMGLLAQVSKEQGSYLIVIRAGE
jgi:TusA-related sulfurtransferase